MLVETYNVNMFPPWIECLNRHAFPCKLSHGERLRAIVACLLRSDADVVLLTELWHEPDAERLVELSCNRWPHCLSNIRSRHSGRVLSSGLMLLSKAPIVSHCFVPFEREAGIDAYAEKGMLVAQLANGLRLVGAHMQAPYTQNSYSDIRWAQAIQLVALAQRTGANCVLGDLNLHPGSTKFSFLQENLLRLGLRCSVSSLEQVDFIFAPAVQELLESLYCYVDWKRKQHALSDHKHHICNVKI